MRKMQRVKGSASWVMLGGLTALGFTWSLTGPAEDKPRTIPAAPTVKVPDKPNYAEHVAPILNRSCVSCHRPGEVAPFSLIGYENAKKWATMVAYTTERRKMPPWKATPGFGDFLDANILSDPELQILSRWAKAGAPRGDAKREPKPPVFPSGQWGLGKPDLEMGMSRPYRLGADGPDDYRNFIIGEPMAADTYITAIDVRPGNPKVVHHVIVFIDGLGQAPALVAANKDGQEGYPGSGGGVGFLPTGSLGGWAPGVRARHLPVGTAYFVPKGARLVMQVHYHRTGKPETDQTKIALYTAKEPIRDRMQMNWIFNFAVNIPPGEKNHRMRQTYTYRRPVTVYGVMPHMHLLGRQMKSWFETPDGKTIPLVDVPDWDFNWQLQYALREPLQLPAGTKQIVEAVYDNSADNPHNPNDPPKRVTWGEETTDEMFLLITWFTVDRSKPR